MFKGRVVNLEMGIGKICLGIFERLGKIWICFKDEVGIRESRLKGLI